MARLVGSGVDHLRPSRVRKVAYCQCSTGPECGVLVTPALLKKVELPDILESASHYVVDDADSGFEEEDPVTFIQWARRCWGTLLLTAKVSPGRWNSQLKDLDLD